MLNINSTKQLSLTATLKDIDNVTDTVTDTVTRNIADTKTENETKTITDTRTNNSFNNTSILVDESLPSFDWDDED